MAYTNLPVIFSKLINEALQKAHVFGSITNADYQGEVRGGSAVKITQFNNITVGDYDPQTGLADPEQIGNSVKTLPIDQFKAFNFYVDSVEQVQRDLPMLQRHAANAAYQIRDVQDQFIASFVTKADAKNVIGSASTKIEISTPSEAYDYLVELKVRLNKANVPMENRSVTCTPEFVGLLQKDNRFAALNNEIVQNGVVGKAAGFVVKESNNISDMVVASHPAGITFASQLEEIKQYEPEKRFGVGMKGLFVYGAEVVEPKALAVLHFTIKAGA